MKPVCGEEKMDDVIVQLLGAAEVLVDQGADTRRSLREPHHSGKNRVKINLKSFPTHLIYIYFLCFITSTILKVDLAFVPSSLSLATSF